MNKFPTDYGVGELLGNQVAARECYVAMMGMDDHLKAMNIEEHWTVIEPIEILERYFLMTQNLIKLPGLVPLPARWSTKY